MFTIAFLSIFLFKGTIAKITEKEYALMPPVFYMDDFDNCMLYGNESLFCKITYELEPLNPNNPPKVWRIIKEVSSQFTNYRHDKLRHSLCIPVTCPNLTWSTKNDPEIREKLTECYNLKYKNEGLKGVITKIQCEITDSSYLITNFDIFVAIFFLLWVIFVLFASFYENFAQYKSQEDYKKIFSTLYGKIILAFSVLNNWKRLKTINNDDVDVNSLRFIQGIRFYNMICVIMLHTIMISLAAPISNPRYTETMTQKILSIFLANGTVGVQAFFMISSWLLTYHIFVACEDKNELKISYLVWIFVNRIIRIVPTLAVVVIFHATWLVHFSRGPNWDMLVGDEYWRCRQNGWTNILFLNNYIDSDNMCLPQTWYTGIDTQLFCLNLFLIWLMWNYPKKISLIIISLLVIHSISMAFTIYWNNYESTLRPLPEDVIGIAVLQRREWHLIMSSIYANLPGITAGLCFGYLFYKRRKNSEKLITRKLYLVLWWLIVWFGALGINILPGLKMYSEDYEHNPTFAVIFGSTTRIIFIFCVGLGLFGVSQGLGGPMKWALEWSPTYILGRLSFSAFLIHTVPMRVRSGLFRSPLYISDTILFIYLFSDVSMGYVAGLLLTLFVEMPISQLQKLILPQKTIEVNEKKHRN